LRVNTIVNLNDVVIRGWRAEQNLDTLHAVLERFPERELPLKPEKCHFASSRVKVLGFVASRGGIEANPEKVQTVNDFPRPDCLKAARSFFGLCGYYNRFIKNFSKISGPLHNLSKKDLPFSWAL
jgi:hypothetical protein